MTAALGLPALAGRVVRGVVAHSSRSLTISFDGVPRAYLWIHLERKDAWYALASELPIEPDPRGSRFQGIEIPIRKARITDARVRECGGLDLLLDARSGEERSLRLTLLASGPRVNLTLATEPGGPTL